MGTWVLNRLLAPLQHLRCGFSLVCVGALDDGPMKCYRFNVFVSQNKLIFTAMVFLSLTGSISIEAAPTAVQETWKTEALAADVLGVASDGSLWTWSRGEGRIRVFRADGTELFHLKIPKAVSAVDVEPSWGVACLDDLGLHLEVRRPDGKALPPLALPYAASSVAWIDENRVAVAPDQAAHRVEIWDVERAQQLHRIGREAVIDDRPGAVFLHRVQLEHDPRTGHLLTLESRTGDFSVFDLEGGELGKGHVTNPRLEELDAWLAEIDRRAREQGDVQRPSLSWFHLALDADGTAWTVEQCWDGSARLVPFRANGTAGRAMEVATACCSLAMVPWQHSWLFHRGPSSLEGPCIDQVPR